MIVATQSNIFYDYVRFVKYTLVIFCAF